MYLHNNLQGEQRRSEMSALELSVARVYVILSGFLSVSLDSKKGREIKTLEFFNYRAGQAYSNFDFNGSLWVIHLDIFMGY